MTKATVVGFEMEEVEPGAFDVVAVFRIEGGIIWRTKVHQLVSGRKVVRRVVNTLTSIAVNAVVDDEAPKEMQQLDDWITSTIRLLVKHRIR